MVVIALTGRRLGRTDKFPYSKAPTLPRAYFDAIERAGGVPVLVERAPDPKDLLARVEALVLTGGPDVDPTTYGQPAHERTYGADRVADDYESILFRTAIAQQLPTLAICRGIQIVNVALGGSLYQHIEEEPGVEPHGAPGEANGERVHDVAIESGTLLRKVLQTDRARCSCHHHQAIARLGDGLRVTARAADGIVEAVELADAPLLAVQWHPEDTAGDDPVQQRLFDWACSCP